MPDCIQSAYPFDNEVTDVLFEVKAVFKAVFQVNVIALTSHGNFK